MLRATACLLLLAWGTSSALGDEAAKSVRDPGDIAAKIDAWIDGRLKQSGIPDSPAATDGEFLRRVSRDITGRIPTHDEAIAFLADRESNKRRKLIDALLARRSYGEHFGTVWRERLAPPAMGKKKAGRDFGRGCLLARRLVESGVPFVEVFYLSNWDSHVKRVADQTRRLMSQVDAGVYGTL